MYLCGVLLCVYAPVANIMCSLWRQISPLGTITSIHLSYSAYTVYNSIKWRLINWQTLLFNGSMLQKTDYRCFPLQQPRTTNFLWNAKQLSVAAFRESRRNLLLWQRTANISPRTKPLISQCCSNNLSDFSLWKWPPCFASLLIKGTKSRLIRLLSVVLAELPRRCLPSAEFAYRVLALERTGLRTNKAHTAANWESSKHL